MKSFLSNSVDLMKNLGMVINVRVKGRVIIKGRVSTQSYKCQQILSKRWYIIIKRIVNGKVSNISGLGLAYQLPIQAMQIYMRWCGRCIKWNPVPLNSKVTPHIGQSKNFPEEIFKLSFSPKVQMVE